MELRQLRNFLAVAETLHFRHASEMLHISQPTLSLQIQQFEEELGVRLLERSSRNVRLTRAGEELAQRARVLLGNADEAVRHTRQVAKGMEGVLSITYVSTALAGMLTRAMKAFQLDNPGAGFELSELRPHEQVARIINGKADIGFMHVMLGEVDPLAFKVVQRDELVIALPAEFEQEGSFDLNRYKDCTIIMPNPLMGYYGFFNYVLRAYHLAGVEPTNVIYANLTSAIRLVAGGLGISIVPSSLQNVECRGIKFRKLQVSPPPIEMLAVWRRDSESMILNRFLKILDDLVEPGPVAGQ